MNFEIAPFEALYPETSRFDEIAKILSYVKEGNSCQVVGLPGVGRGNLLNFLAYNRNIRIKHLGENQKWLYFVFLNFSEVKNKPVADVTKLLFFNLVESLRERKMDEAYQKANEMFKESLQFNDELILFQGLKRAIDFCAIQLELTIIFLFERFETYIPMLTSSFFTNLRILRSKAKYRFSAVFSVTRPLEDTVETGMLYDFYEYLAGHTVYLPILDQPALAFRIAYLEKAIGAKIDGKIVEKILSFTGGHAKLTRICLETIVVQPKKPSIDIQFFFGQKRIQATLVEIWQALTPLEQKFLLIEQPPYPSIHPYLMDSGLIHAGIITIALFALFITQKQKEHKKTHEMITFHSDANTIMKGELILSEQLTISEFRLLKFLLEHPDKVVEKELIINAVWKDAKSTMGVTDQALDQLVFRLRKKVEDDPNVPVYIQTVKGRGLRFTRGA